VRDIESNTLIFNIFSKCTNRENVQNVKFTNCPHAFPFLSGAPRNLVLLLQCQREQTTTTDPEDNTLKTIKNKIH